MVEPPPLKPKMFWDIKGFHSCGHCYSCTRVPRNVRKVNEFTNPQDNRLYNIRDFISCDTVCVVYAVKCPCNKIYVGRTKALIALMEEHVRNIRKGFDKHFLSVHFRDAHKSTDGMQFWGIEAPKHHSRGSNYVRDINKRESWWIHQLGSLTPGGVE